MESKTVNSVEDVKGILYIIDYVHKEFFPSATILDGSNYLDISIFIKQLGIDISVSTVRRIFIFRRDPHPITYKKLDDIVYWCFDGDYKNFITFLSEKQEEIESANLISQEEIEEILPILLSKNNSLVTLKSKALTLDSQKIEINDTEGYLKKFFNTLSDSIGDFTEQSIDHSEKQQTNALFPVKGRMAERILRREERRQINIEQIILKTLPFVKNKKSSNLQPEEDWVTDFFETVQDTSDEHMQFLWAKLLANEVDKPGSYSRRAVNAIKLLSSQEASLFSLLCNCLWEIHPGETRSDLVLIKNSDNKGYYSDTTWGFDGSLLRHLEDLGLVHETFMVLEKDESYNISYFGKNHEIGTNENALEMELVRLSTVGAEIYNVVMTNKNEEYYRFTIDYLKKIELLKN